MPAGERDIQPSQGEPPRDRILIFSKTMVNGEYRKKYRFLAREFDLHLVVPERFLQYTFQPDQTVQNLRITVLPLRFPDSFHLHFFLWQTGSWNSPGLTSSTLHLRLDRLDDS